MLQMWCRHSLREEIYVRSLRLLASRFSCFGLPVVGGTEHTCCQWSLDRRHVYFHDQSCTELWRTAKYSGEWTKYSVSPVRPRNPTSRHCICLYSESDTDCLREQGRDRWDSFGSTG